MNGSTGKKHGIFLGFWLLIAGLTPSHASIHDGKILDCNGCHNIKAPDPSSICLDCHAHEYRVLSEKGDAYTPGGDFYWLSQDYIARCYISFGDTHGHNIIAAAHYFTKDGLRIEAPGIGGPSYRAEWLACTSCHDPHLSRSETEPGYRLLGGQGYKGGGKASGFVFSQPAPIAEPTLSDFSDWLPESDVNHPDYISGMSEWCTNCHTGYLSNKGLSHPAGPMARLDDLARIYRQSGNSVNRSGGRSTDYDFLVPFERGDEGSDAQMDGPSSSANVMCLTCHRAHASPFKHIGRWDLEIKTRLADSPVLRTPKGIHAYYGQSITDRYGNSMKTLCVLCHAVD